jgi:hypothetical protein
MIDIAHQVVRRGVAKFRIIHQTVKDIFIAFHAVNQETFEHAIKNWLKVFHAIDLGCGY